MKKWIIICLLIVIAVLWINKNISDKMYEDCMSAKKQSKETCEYYVYYQ